MDDSIRVRVRYMGAFAELARSKEETCKIAVPLLGALIDHLTERNGEKFRLLVVDTASGAVRGGTTLLVNGNRCDLNHRLSDGDEVALLTPVAGGSHG